MHIVRKTIIAGLAVLSFGSAAMAAPAQETPHKHEYAATKFDPAKRAEHIAQHQQKLHDALKLTASQETAWQTYSAAVQSRQTAGRPDRASVKEMNAPQRLEKRLEISKARIAQDEARLQALKTFYAVLTPEQQKVFDEQAHEGGRKHRSRHHG